MCSLGYFLLIAGQETPTRLISATLFRLLQGSAPRGWKDAASGTGSRDGQAYTGHRIIDPHMAPPCGAGHQAGNELIPVGTVILLELTGRHGTSSTVSAQACPRCRRIGFGLYAPASTDASGAKRAVEVCGAVGQLKLPGVVWPAPCRSWGIIIDIDAELPAGRAAQRR